MVKFRMIQDTRYWKCDAGYEIWDTRHRIQDARFEF